MPELPEKLPEPRWRVLAKCNREYMMPGEITPARWWYTTEELNDSGDWVTMFAQQDPPHFLSRAHYLTVIPHPLNDAAAVEIIENSKEPTP